MKHNLKIIFLLIILFLLAQLIGLFIIKTYTIKELPYNVERPKLDEKTSFLPIFIAILIATVIALILLRFEFIKLWKIWFFLAVVFALSIALSAFFNETAAFILAIIFAVYKIIRRNLFIHNFTELFIYGGITAIFVPLFNIFSVSLLLILISVYDFIAVFKTKHMVKLAKFQSKLKIFAGFLIPYKKRSAILGGGDIGFPLLFSGVLLQQFGYKAFIVSIFAAIALLILLVKGQRKKFYPAMPFITVGCFIGYLFLLIY